MHSANRRKQLNAYKLRLCSNVEKNGGFPKTHSQELYRMHKMARLLKEVLLNRYLLALAAFVVWMLFFDKNDFLTQKQRREDLEALNKKIEYYRQQIEGTRQQLHALQNDPETLEKTAREKYLMKRANEEVFVIEVQ